MSHSSKPTIPFVLPVYEMLYTHISSVIEKDTPTDERIRQAAIPALAKLQKYREKALTNHFYKLGTCKSVFSTSQHNMCLSNSSTSSFSPRRVVPKSSPKRWSGSPSGCRWQGRRTFYSRRHSLSWNSPFALTYRHSCAFSTRAGTRKTVR